MANVVITDIKTGEAPPRARMLRVLVADDDRDLVLSLTALLRMEGHDARGALSGFDFYLMKPCDPNALLMLLRWVRIESPFRTAFR